jgi:MFS family permease
MSFVNAHFVSYAQDLGFHPMVAASAFSVIGATAVFGALILGHLSDQHGRRRMLSLSYHLRAMGFFVVLLSMGIPFLGVPSLGLPALFVGILLVGFSWNAVVGITAAYASDGFGTSNLGQIYGTMFAVMPIGSGLGAYLGGLFYDIRGTYDLAVWSNVVLLLVSTLLVLSIRDRTPGSATPAKAEEPEEGVVADTAPGTAPA